MLNVVVLTTGPLVTLQDAKEHLNVDHTDDDALIDIYTDAAVLSCLNACDRQLVPVGAEPAFRAAALLTLGSLYANRESIITGTIVALNPTVEALLAAYRVYRV